jgi:hypothetical protein
MTDHTEQLTCMAVQMAVSDNAVLITFSDEGDVSIRALCKSGVPGALAALRVAIKELEQVGEEPAKQ